METTPCKGLGGECKNNGQFDGLCYFCHVDARQGDGCTGMCESPACAKQCNRRKHERSQYHLCADHQDKVAK